MYDISYLELIWVDWSVSIGTDPIRGITTEKRLTNVNISHKYGYNSDSTPQPGGLRRNTLTTAPSAFPHSCVNDHI